MKEKLIFLFFSIIFTQFSFAQSQAQMNNDSYISYKKVDDELGVVYQKVIKKYAKNPDFIAALRASERLWIQLRDAEIKMRFPAKDPRFEYGSVYPMCVNIYLESITKTRISYLKEWLQNADGGDVCSGSVGAY
jgi:uncharacterized protein YecT (DUF1311 family)